MKTYDYLFFDLDNTLTRSRNKITQEMKDALAAHTSQSRKVIVVSGATCEQIAWQMDSFPCFILGKNGNQALDEAGKELWRNPDLTEIEKREILDHIALIPRTWEVPDENDLIEDRGCQLCYSLYGHHADVSVKEKFDPELSLRKQLLETYPFVSETVVVKIGGTTTFDYFRVGGTKGDNVARLITHMVWEKSQAAYFGDRLFPGGNDESVIGVIDTVQVTNPSDTIKKLQAML